MNNGTSMTMTRIVHVCILNMDRQLIIDRFTRVCRQVDTWDSRLSSIQRTIVLELISSHRWMNTLERRDRMIYEEKFKRKNIWIDRVIIDFLFSWYVQYFNDCSIFILTHDAVRCVRKLNRTWTRWILIITNCHEHKWPAYATMNTCRRHRSNDLSRMSCP
jgi:hypothetical protein